ncbi:MAG: hypothetical protein GXO90_10025 [FCB group bacterium]|nr:hypothetical protein [FCB group bacterium]
MKNRLVLISIVFLALVVYGCNRNTENDPTDSYINVLILDSDLEQTPISGVEVTLAPVEKVKVTDEYGKCSFSVEPGNYIVNASVCCVGPGNIVYHDSVSVALNQTVNDTLYGCTMCE